jgi:quercetin dioxygenase-like cupin family protein
MEIDWTRPALLHLSEQDINDLVDDSRLFIAEHFDDATDSYPQHAHSAPQALLVLEGEMTHFSEAGTFTQRKGDLLIVPAHLRHSAKIGAEGVRYLFIAKR